MLYIASIQKCHASVQCYHITSSSHYLQSNGLAKKHVQIVKWLFNKAKEEGKDFYKCLMI